MARRAELSEATRTRIVAAVLDLVREGGAEAIVVSAIAARADIALRTVYYHFPSRGSLLAAALADLARRVSVDSLRAWRDERPAREVLAGYLTALYQDYDELSPWLTPILATAGLPELDEAVQRIRARARDRLREILTPFAVELRVPLDTAVAIAYLQTPYPA
jgi:AcrR family transcriptional regulator